MTVRELTFEEFNRLFGEDIPVVFGNSDFNKLNAYKADEVRAIGLFDDGNVMGGQIFGRVGAEWRAPFSAPFSLPFLKEGIDADTFYKTVKERQHFESLVVTWPSPIYTSLEPPVTGRVVEDYNYHYPLERFRDFEKYMSKAGRKNLHAASRHDFNFYKTDLESAYRIIEANRSAMDYPLAMTLKQVAETMDIIPADFFRLTLDGVDVASAIVFEVAKGIVQVVYWGDLPFSRPMRAMNALAKNVFEWYSQNRPDIDIVDLGPSSKNGILNEGLARFKLSLGCIETFKPTIYIE